MESEDLERIAGHSSRSRRPVDLDAWANARDAPAFETEWMRVDSLVSSVADPPWLAGLQELSYREAYSLTNSPELAGYVSDDFDLLGRAVAQGISDPWLALILDWNDSGELPPAADR